MITIPIAMQLAGMMSNGYRLYSGSAPGATHTEELNFAPVFTVAFTVLTETSTDAINMNGETKVCGIIRYRHRDRPDGADQWVDFTPAFLRGDIGALRTLIYQDRLTSLTYLVGTGTRQTVRGACHLLFFEP